MKRLGRHDPGRYPLLPICPECGFRLPGPEAPNDLPCHWPWCRYATREQMRLWQDRERLRNLRTARRIDP